MNFSEGRGNVAIAYEFSKDDRVNDQDRDFLRAPRAAELAQNQDDLDDSPDLPDNVPYNDIRYADSSFLSAVDVDGDGLSDFEGTGSASTTAASCSRTPAATRRADPARRSTATRATCSRKWSVTSSTCSATST